MQIPEKQAEEQIQEEPTISFADELKMIQKEAEKKRATERAQKEKEFQEAREKKKLEQQNQISQQAQECAQNALPFLKTVATMSPSYNGGVIGTFDIISDEEAKSLLEPLFNKLLEEKLTVFLIRGHNQVYNHQFEPVSQNAYVHAMKPNHANPKQIEGYQVTFKVDSESSPRKVWFASKEPELLALRSQQLKVVACWE